MNVLAGYDMYEDEIKFVKKYDEVACTLDQLNKKKQLRFIELHRIVDGCLDEKISQRSYEQCIKRMALIGLVMETFTNDQKFNITLSTVGKDVYQTIKNNDKHLVAAHS